MTEGRDSSWKLKLLPFADFLLMGVANADFLVLFVKWEKGFFTKSQPKDYIVSKLKFSASYLFEVQGTSEDSEQFQIGS